MSTSCPQIYVNSELDPILLISSHEHSR